MKNEIRKLRNQFDKLNIDGYVVPKNDEFFSEYSNKDTIWQTVHHLLARVVVPGTPAIPGASAEVTSTRTSSWTPTIQAADHTRFHIAHLNNLSNRAKNGFSWTYFDVFA